MFSYTPAAEVKTYTIHQEAKYEKNGEPLHIAV
jgi:hypothetical protein